MDGAIAPPLATTRQQRDRLLLLLAYLHSYVLSHKRGPLLTSRILLPMDRGDFIQTSHRPWIPQNVDQDFAKFVV